MVACGVGRIDRQPLAVLGQHPLQIDQARARLHADHHVAGLVARSPGPAAAARSRRAPSGAAGPWWRLLPLPSMCSGWPVGARLAHQRGQLLLGRRGCRAPAVWAAGSHQCPSGSLRPLPVPGSTQRPGAGITLPGLHSPRGLNTSRSRRIRSRSASLNSCAHVADLLEADAVFARQRAAHRRSPAARCRRPAARTRSITPGWRSSYSTTGCRLPSPAWNTLPMVSWCALGDAGDLRQHLGQLACGG